MIERRAGPEMSDAEADLAELQGRLPLLGKLSDIRTQGFRRGIGDSMQA
jgi:hypothetical protein